MKKSFVIPKSILSQLNECSSGGFLLFAFDEIGTARSYVKFDSEMHLLALQKTAEYWIEGMEAANLEQMKTGLEDSDGFDDNEEWLDDFESDDDSDFSS
tara:strand:+ start:116 stop:412 length:297 start_codon:yes stop_codon:yes gene_type:complete